MSSDEHDALDGGRNATAPLDTSIQTAASEALSKMMPMAGDIPDNGVRGVDGMPDRVLITLTRLAQLEDAERNLGHLRRQERGEYHELISLRAEAAANYSRIAALEGQLGAMRATWASLKTLGNLAFEGSLNAPKPTATDDTDPFDD